MAIVIFGDVHFNDERPWSLEAGRSFIKFLDECEDNNEDNVGVFLGDITEKASISPLVYELIFEFLHSLKFDTTYILCGNHDRKKKRDKMVSPLSFLQSNKNPYTRVQFITQPSIKVEQGRDLIFLPFKAINEEPNMNLYKEDLPEEWYDAEKALIFGHFADTSSEAVRDNLINISRFKGEIVLGHIHNPFSSHYLGAVMPNSYSEKNLDRVYRVYEKEGYTAKPVPRILDYYDIVFPEDLPEVECQFPIYTIHNCQSTEAAQSRYPGIYIRKCIYDNLVDVDSFSDLISSASSEHSLAKTITTWLDTQDNMTSNIKEKVLKYFHATN